MKRVRMTALEYGYTAKYFKNPQREERYLEGWIVEDNEVEKTIEKMKFEHRHLFADKRIYITDIDGNVEKVINIERSMEL